MNEVPLYTSTYIARAVFLEKQVLAATDCRWGHWRPEFVEQGYLAHKTTHPSRTLP